MNHTKKYVGVDAKWENEEFKKLLAGKCYIFIGTVCCFEQHTENFGLFGLLKFSFQGIQIFFPALGVLYML